MLLRSPPFCANARKERKRKKEGREAGRKERENGAEKQKKREMKYWESSVPVGNTARAVRGGKIRVPLIDVPLRGP